jgi:hypothetical protein
MSDLTRMEIIIGGNQVELDPQFELKMDETTINDDLKKQPSLFAWYAVLEELAEKDFAEAKLTVDLVSASLDQSYREKAVQSNTKLTETQLINQIRLDNQFLDATAKVNECRKNVGVLRALKEAFGQRKDMLITLASNMRAQSDPDIYLKKQEAKNALSTGGKL